MRGARSIVVLVVAELFAATLAAQGVRWTATSQANYFELRPVVEDSIADSLTTGAGLVRQSGVGLVSCPTGHSQCYFYRSLERAHTIPFTQDIEGTAWGFGEGVSVYAHLRGRGNLGGIQELWTREDERFTALSAYVELDRDRFTARAGRQWLTSQLGVNNFDGASLAVRPARGVVVEGYAGRSLVQGLSESLTSSGLAAADVLPPDVGGLIFGVKTSWRARPTAAVNAEYQREIRSDRAGFYSERLSLDAALAMGGTSLTVETQADLVTTALNELRVRASRPLSSSVGGSLEAVHSTPFFPLWTIWGVFSPVGFDEARADARWQSRDERHWASIGGGYRRYQDTHTGVGFLPLRNDGWTVLGAGGWHIRQALGINGSYRRDIGFGASKSDGSAGLRWTRAGGASFGLTASATQNIFEFRLANGYLVGGAVDGELPLTSSLRLFGQIGAFQHVASNTPSATVNWTQRRAVLRLEWSGGGDPGSQAKPSMYGGASP